MKELLAKIPSGHFEVTKNCTTCVFANWNDKDSYGRVHCDGGYGGYNRPGDRNGCFHWRG